MGKLIRGDQIQPGDVIRTANPFSDWYGQVERLEPHGAEGFDGWQVAHFYNARAMSIGPEQRFFVKRGGD